MPTLDLRRQAAEVGLDLKGAALTAEDRAAAIGTWRGRMVNEHISARVFSGLIPQMMEADVDASHQAAVAEMIAEELRHAVLCAAAVHALGGEPVAPLPALDAVPWHEGVDPLESLVRNVISICCMSETVAVSLIGAERLETGPPELAEMLKQILADEVGHARFGWRLLDEVDERLGPDAKRRLSDYLITAFAHLEEHELAHLPPKAPPSERARAVGVCDGNDARTLFYDTVTDVIVPGLEKRGYRAADAWAASRSVTRAV